MLTEADRCSLTFLAIQEPGISKYCNTCGREYLNETTMAIESEQMTMQIAEGTLNNEGRGEQRTQTDQFFLQMLFQKYDTCIFCPGKFIG